MSQRPHLPENNGRAPPRIPNDRTAYFVRLSLALVAGLAAGLGLVVLTLVSPTTYRTTAVVVLDVKGEMNLPEPLESARRLHEAVLDRKLLEQLSEERAQSAEPVARAQAASAVRNALEIGTSDGRTFSIVFRDSEAGRVQRICNLLAHRAAELAPRVLAPERPDASASAEKKRQEQMQKLVAFLAAHPEVTMPVAVTPASSRSSDPGIAALIAAQDRLKVRLAEVTARGAAAGPANPYDDPEDVDPAALKRRIAQIESTIIARKKALERSTGAESKLAPEIEREWKQLLANVSEAHGATDAAAASPPVLLSARVEREAVRPRWPIEPNRPLWLVVALLAVPVAMAVTWSALAAWAGRSKSRTAPAMRSVPLQAPAPPPAAQPGPAFAAPSFEPARPVAPAPPPQLPPAQHSASRSPEASAPPHLGHFEPEPPQLTRLFPLDPEPPLPSPQAHWREAGAPTIDLVTEAAPPASDPRHAMRPPEGRGGYSEPPPVAPGNSSGDVHPSHRPKGPHGEYLAVIDVGGNEPPPDNVKASRHETLSWGRPRRAMTQPLGSFATAEALAAQSPSSAPPGSARTSPTPERPRSNPPPEKVRSTPPPAGKSARVAPDTGYRFVSSSPPPLERAAAPSEAARPAEPTTGAARTSSRPPPQPKPPAVGVVQVTSPDWQPDPRLDLAQRRELRDQLFPMALEGCFVLAVVGVPEAATQKSAVAAELALALAEPAHPRILLMEGDLQRPAVHRLMRVEMPLSAGFSQQLYARVHGKTKTQWTVLSCAKTLHVLAEGMMRAPGLVLSTQFEQSVSELRGFYDFIVIDGPLTSGEVDCRAIDAVVDGVIVVCQKADQAAVARAMMLFSQKRFTTVVHV